MNTQQIAACTGASLALAERYAGPLQAAMMAYGIDRSTNRICYFLANVGHESDGMQTLTENLNYKVEALLNKFGRHRISEADARAYGRTPTRAANQEAIANIIYGGAWGLKFLGNTKPDDGWRLRGHGLLQNTGRSNMVKLTQRLRQRLPGQNVPDFAEDPAQLLNPVWAAYAAADYCDMRNVNALADKGDFDGYCDVVNIGKETDAHGDASGFEDRMRRLQRGLVAMR